MNNFAIQLLRKNPKLDLIFVGKSSAKVQIAKLKLLCNLKVKKFNFNYDELRFLSLFEATHVIMDKDTFLLSERELSNTDLDLSSYSDYANFALVFQGIDGKGLELLLPYVKKILRHPALILSTDNNDALILILGNIYRLGDITGITKAFNEANKLYELYNSNMALNRYKPYEI